MSSIRGDKYLKGFISGNKAVIKDLYTVLFPKVKRYIERNSGTDGDAKDVFQDALMLTYQKLKTNTFRLDCSLTTYIFAVSRYIWMNNLRKKGKVLLYQELPEIKSVLSSDIIEEIHANERHLLYQKYFLKLGEQCQQLLLLFFSGKSMKEIATEMNYSLGYTRKKKFKCKQQLLAMIESDPVFKELSARDENERIA